MFLYLVVLCGTIVGCSLLIWVVPDSPGAVGILIVSVLGALLALRGLIRGPVDGQAS
ncbi:hypothetical protein [Halalkalicoccus subterraneus]|uniref:hypothetical protein n=1 Tax=Halalkalicoccus subterraneus TaxID=2675002 RepID=UPI0013CE7FC5|nr:hypothetical protein [Halalkalicoccus subterraneus]